MRSAKELCALLITRGLKDLGEDEEEIVVDYLEDIGIEVDLDAKPRDLCAALLEKAMVKDLGKKVPLTAYANSLLGKVEKVKSKIENIADKRKNLVRALENRVKNLPGCIVSDDKILQKTMYDFKTDENLGIMVLENNEMRYSAVVSLSQNLYDKIFSKYESPVLELISSKGSRAYGRVAEIHSDSDNIVYISPLLAKILDIGTKGGGFLKLCSSLPEIRRINFTFYGTDAKLQKSLKKIIDETPSVINAFSYLSLGLMLIFVIDGKEVELRVDGLFDADDSPIFAGVIPFSESDIPFDIVADL